jgi:hypothetical protein
MSVTQGGNVHRGVLSTTDDVGVVAYGIDGSGNYQPLSSAGAGNITQVEGVAPSTKSGIVGVLAFVQLDPATGLPALLPAVTQVNTEGQKATYSATMVAVAAAANATDIFTITGSGTKLVRILRFGVSGIATAVGTQQVNLIKRSTADTAGTSAAVAAVAHDSANAAATATVLSYTANPTLGTTVGTIRSAALALGAAAAVGSGEKEWRFSEVNDQSIVLRGTGQVLALNLNAAILAGATLTAWVEWTEE